MLRAAVGTVAIWLSEDMLSEGSFDSLVNMVEELDDGGEVDATDAGLRGWTLLCGGVIDRFCGEVMGIFTLDCDTMDAGGGPAVELIGEWRGVSWEAIDRFCAVIEPLWWPLGGDSRMFGPDI
jgi:hypothetical protein